jgi:hypothetical protein
MLELAAFPREPAEIEERLDLELRIGGVLRLLERLRASSRATSEPRVNRRISERTARTFERSQS